ncbi:hypothetical protein [Spirilliplanes yamanashiensis]|uniref:Uncharacterized protein n=1 Tax=Spirilliplanes yamanashiensis TaxID=42233 RepID=A0A8J4DGE0_9ACTN|nr:hypothetical protein [Spirilliplanes yamanashiensis]MDP9819864.1 hypothetical protein [Spirilliplanes yamanashiensis]GIJ01317.1 hypothetical protein Sya03_06690 [Spirilliplanes yamanashiensis]
MLTRIGFFREFFADHPELPSIRDHVRPHPAESAGQVVAYLRAGHVMSAVMEGMTDVIDGRSFEEGSGCSSLLTDGTWLWRRDLAHYVEAHNVELPAAFLRQAARGEVPPLSADELAELETIERRDYGPDWWVGP